MLPLRATMSVFRRDNAPARSAITSRRVERAVLRLVSAAAEEVVDALDVSAGLDANVALAAVFAALAPAALINAGTIDTVGRWVAMGCVLLAVARAIELDRDVQAGRTAAAAVGLQLLAVAWHPSAVVAPVALAVVFAGVGIQRRRHATAVVAGGLLAAGAWIALSRQGAIAAVGMGSLLDALWFQPLLAALMTGWQLPVVGRLWPMVPVAMAAIVVPAAAVLLAVRGERVLAAVVAASLLLMLPDGASVGFLPAPVIAWTVGTTQSAMGAGVVASLLTVVALRGRSARGLAIAVLLVAALVRGVLLMDARHADAAADAQVQRLLAVQLLIPAAARDDVRPSLVGSPDALMAPLKSAKWIPELPRSRRRAPELGDRRDRVVGRVQGAPLGFDGAVWLAAVHRCELWLGLERNPDGPCGEHPVVLDDIPRGWSCSLDVRGADWHPRCPPRRAARIPSDARDPRAVPWAVVALLSLGAAARLGYGSRRSKT